MASEATSAAARGRRFPLRALVAVAAALLSGAVVGIGGFTFVYARGGAYLTNDPTACANCHVMREQYQG